MSRRRFYAALLPVTLLSLRPGPPDPRSAEVEHIVIDANAPTTPFPHFWEQTFGSGRAILPCVRVIGKTCAP